jgi:hypothetical protein
MNTTTNTSLSSKFIPVVLVFAGLICLYYLYQYLFGPNQYTAYSLISGKTNATVDPTKPIIVTSDKLPALYEGGEFTISTWIYVNNWAYRRGFNKSIVNIGGPNFDTIRVYLGGYKPSLSVRLHTKDASGANNTVPTGVTPNNSSKTDSLDKVTQNVTFNVLQPDSDLLSTSTLCDLPQIDLQRWVCLTVAVNGKTVDVYYDGKLARSCVLPSFYKVDAGGYSASLLAYGGFGGEIATTNIYSAALNPEQIYKIYMAGPDPVTNIVQWLTSFFVPNISVSVNQTN